MINIVSCRGDAAVGVAREDQLDVAHALVFFEDFSAALLEFSHQAEGVALEDEVQVADGHPGNQVTDCSADQIDVCHRGGGEFLHAHHRRALLGGEPASQQEHVVRHDAPRSLS